MPRSWSLALLPAFVFLVAVSAHASFTEERPVSPPGRGAAPSDQFKPVIASNGTSFLAAWLDARSLPLSIYANRVQADGTVLDGTGIRIPMAGDAANVHIAGLFHLDGVYELIYSYQLFDPRRDRTEAVSISDEGEIVVAPHVIASDASATAAASNGSRVLILGNDGLSGIFRRILVNGHGEVLSDIAAPDPRGYGATVASNGSTFLAGSFSFDGSANSINVTAIDGNGATLGTTRFGASPSGDHPIIASDGDRYLVLYTDVATFKPVAVLVAANAAIVTSHLLDIQQSLTGPAALIWTGQSYSLSTTSNDAKQSVTVLTLNRDAVPTGTPLILDEGTPGSANEPAAAWNGREVLVAWTSGSQQSLDALEVHGQVLGSHGELASPLLVLPRSGELQVTPVLASGGANDLVAWMQPDGVHAKFVTANGAPFDSPGLLFVQAGESRSLTITPGLVLRATFDGSSYLVAWKAQQTVLGARVNPATGEGMGPIMTLAPCVSSFDLATDRTSAVFFGVSCSTGRVYSQRIGAIGVEGAPIDISPAGMLAAAPDAAWNGHEWLVAYQELIHLPVLIDVYRGNLHAVRLSAELTPLDTAPLDVAISALDEGMPFVATDGHDFAIVWSHRSYDPSQGITMRRVRDDGSLTSPVPLVAGFGEAQSLIWIGSSFVLAYSTSPSSWNRDLYLTRFDPAGNVQPAQPVSATASDEASTSLAPASDGGVLVAYTRVAAEGDYGGVSRVFLRKEPLTARRRAAGR